MKKGNKILEKEEGPSKKDIGLWNVISFIFAIFASIFSIFSGIVTFKAGQLIVGLLFIILAAFPIIPRKYLKITRTLKGTIFLTIYFILLIISGINTPAPEKQYEYYFLEQSFNLTYKGENISIVVNNITTRNNITFEGKEMITSGLYLFITGEITNLGKSPIDFKIKSELKDGDGNLYTPLGKDMGIGSFQPGLDRKFVYLFEIPKEVSKLEFSIEDESKITKIINLI